MAHSTQSRRAGIFIVLALVASLLVGALTGTTPAGAAADDGLDATSAAPSCWWIKQQDPSAADGIYWLQTPTLVAPQQFYCDMTTDGGGWVLIGRGRENWTMETRGQGSPAAIRNTPDSVGAFDAAALSGETIDGLLDGSAPADLTDGVRIRRARNQSGTQWQEYWVDFATMQTWSWGWGGSMEFDQVTIDGETYFGSNSADTAVSFYTQTGNGLAGRNDERRLITKLWSTTNWRVGFTYGAGVGGSTSSSSYLFKAGSSSSNYAMPFAQVWVRPRLGPLDVAYDPIPSGGTSADARHPLLEDTPASLPWGVAGIGPHQEWSSPRDHEVPVWAFAQIGTTIYVGGMFTDVVNGPSDPGTEQRYLAAFDMDTGAWIDTFRPDVERPVYDLDVTPDGRLLVAGEFRDIDGVAGTQGIAVVDPATGAPDPAWRSDVAYANGDRPAVHSIDVEGNQVTLGGDFDTVRRDGESDFAVFRITRFSTVDGAVDFLWRPAANGEVVSVDASPTRTYLAGHFSSINSEPDTANFTAVNTSDGEVASGIAPFEPSYPVTRTYQQATFDAGTSVTVGGSEHSFQLLDPVDHSLIKSHITRPGGDFQALLEVDGVVYGTCHCNQWVFAGAEDWPAPAGYTETHRIRYVVAADAATGELFGSFYPNWEMSNYFEGPWTAYEDSNGCAWIGGDIARGAWNGSGFDWLGNFTRLCGRDTTVPTEPGALVVNSINGQHALSWGGSADDVTPFVQYEILRDDRVVAVQYSTTWTDTDGAVPHSYAVRAIDDAGNRSSSTDRVDAVPPPPPAGILVDADDDWRHLSDGSAPPADWTVDADLTSWPVGAAELGWGDGDENTVIPSAPLVHYFATDVDASATPANGAVLLRIHRDDGILVRLDGLEVFRDNLPAGPAGAGTYALGPVYGATEDAWLDVTLPTSLFTSPDLRISAQLHQAWSNNPDASFALEAIVLTDSGDTIAPDPVSASVVAGGPTTNTVNWTTPSDDVAVGWVLVLGGEGGAPLEPIAVLDSTATTFEHDIAAGESWSYQVDVIDTNSNVTSSAVVGAPVVEVLVDHDDDWAWVYDDVPIDPDWNTVGFDDGAWAVGPGPLGFGDPGLGTVIRTDPSPHPLTAYFRTEITVADATTLGPVDLEVVRDDGVAVYVNGVEVGRDNLPGGPLSQGTYATGVYGAAELVPVTFTVPASAFVTGSNTIAVEIHQDWRGSPDLRFSLAATTGP